ncbi:hypothetical protein ACPESL_13610 [Psychrobacter pocilloporae]|uniref:hypothetical protein n=1 Tax=Psychrobacter TaxID=497 RepID=UPI00078BB49B|nr:MULTISPECIES: hypothetical protein [unclassified Psychrobacter]AMN68162.1 hypothetical protein AK825_11000 [Psychrobacter sp. P11G5]PKH66065.1 hypothetical protein CXF61_03385 [Psychrobacter sp. 4Dc]|tara:strand:+ start:3021 stop:3293 length:273 start_codon:yes stop_codon:yes gene_type:complete
MSQFKLLSKSIAMTVIALVVSTSAMAHDPKLHAKKDQMNCEKLEKNMQMMQKMDHSKMDMKDPAMKAMMANMGKMKQMYQKNCVTNDSKS